MLARLVPSLTGRPFTSLAASRSPTASGRATMCSTTRTRAKSTTPSFGRWLTNGFASCISAGRSAPRTTRTYTWKYSKNGAQFSPPCTCKQNDKNYGRHGSGDYPEATPRLPRGYPEATHRLHSGSRRSLPKPHFGKSTKLKAESRNSGQRSRKATQSHPKATLRPGNWEEILGRGASVRAFNSRLLVDSRTELGQAALAGKGKWAIIGRISRAGRAGRFRYRPWPGPRAAQCAAFLKQLQPVA